MTIGPDDKWVAGDAYEAYMGRWSRRIAREFVAWLHPEAAGHWLEVGCGTGALTSAVCEVCKPASVVACDPSESFVEHARKNISDRRASFIAAGADTLPTRIGGFDGIVSGLVLNFLPDPGRTLSSLCDRLRPGGTIAAYVWDYADGMEFLRIFWEEAVAQDSKAAAIDERLRFPLCNVPALESLFRTAGLARVETHALMTQTDFANFENFWTPFLRGTGPAPSYVASLDPGNRESLRERLRRRLSAGSDASITLGARAWAVRGK
jgi:trans-aconitate methyltransferase